MHLIGRWERVREIGPRGWGHGYMLDRKWSELRPVKGEWWRTKRGLWVPTALVDQRGALNFAKWGGPFVGYGLNESNSYVVTNLSTAYTYGSAGAAIGNRITLLDTLTLNDVYFRINAYGGTAGNVNDIDVEVRNESSGKPGSTLHATQTVNPSSATGWIKTTGFSFSMTGGTTYWLVVADPDGGADFAAVTNRAGFSSNVGDVTKLFALLFSPGTTSNGFSTIGLTDTWAIMALHFSNGLTIGNPFTANATVTSDTNQKGLYMGNGFDADVRLWGVRGVGANTAWNAVNVYAGSDLPNASTFATTSSVLYEPASGTNIGGFIFAGALRLSGRQTYRVVFGFASTQGQPRKLSIGTGSDANLRACMLGGGNWYYTTENGGPGWTDDQDGYPQMALLVDDVVASGGALVNGGLVS